MTGWWEKLRRSDELAGLQRVLEDRIRSERATQDALDRVEKELELERARRVTAEALATERRSEVDRLYDELHDMRGQLGQVMVERLRSLDALNVRLLEPRVEPPPPDLGKFKPALDPERGRKLRDIDRQVSQALLGLPRRRSDAVRPDALRGPVLEAGEAGKAEKGA